MRGHGGLESFRENILFTHRGLGKAILQASNYWQPGGGVEFNLVPTANIAEALNENRRTAAAITFERLAAGVCPRHLPRPLAMKPLNEPSNRT